TLHTYLSVLRYFPASSAYTHPPYIFFFSCDADHRDLHSFPTRRSSDLGSEQDPAALLARVDLALEVYAGQELLLHRLRGRDLHRSEEHTSELQSRFDLVCRLLLEKKKKKNKRELLDIMPGSSIE